LARADRLGIATAPSPRAQASVINGQLATAAGPMALIVRADDALCTGTIISVNVVLTAAHSVVDENTNTIVPASAFAVKIGSTTISNTQPGQVSAVSRVVMDPLYSPVTAPMTRRCWRWRARCRAASCRWRAPAT
jgi:hypothetical protein